jgi:hypothetical protein
MIDTRMEIKAFMGLYKKEVFFSLFFPFCFHFKPLEMSSSSSSNSSFSNSDDFISYSSDEDVLEDMDQNDLVSFQMMAMATSNSNDLFT